MSLHDHKKTFTSKWETTRTTPSRTLSTPGLPHSCRRHDLASACTTPQPPPQWCVANVSSTNKQLSQCHHSRASTFNPAPTRLGSTSDLALCVLCCCAVVLSCCCAVVLLCCWAVGLSGCRAVVDLTVPPSDLGQATVQRKLLISDRQPCESVF